MMRVILFIALTLPVQLFASAIGKKRDVPYVDQGAVSFDAQHHTLDIYYPKDTLVKRGVIIFFHGGSWSSGDKNTYRFMAKNFVKKGFVAVMVNYRLAPAVEYDAMVEDCEHAVGWVCKNISSFGGDAEKIILAGHSAGGQIIALTFLEKLNKQGSKTPVSKVLLIDPFGLDMVTYFKEYNNDYSRGLLKVFTDKPEEWKKASALYYIDANVKCRFLILTGSKTFPTITKGSKAFHEKLLANGVRSEYQVIQGKKHIAMIIQFFFRHNKAYKRIMPFLEA